MAAWLQGSVGFPRHHDKEQSKYVQHRAEKQSSESYQGSCVHLVFTVYALRIVP